MTNAVTWQHCCLFASRRSDSLDAIKLRRIASGRREDAHGGRAQDQSERQNLAGGRERGHAAALRAYERARAERTALRLRAGAMRLLLGARRRRRDPLLRDAGCSGRGQIAHHARGPRGALRAAEGARASAGAPSPAAGLHRRAGAAVRLLLQRNADQGRRAARADSTPHRSADPHAHERPPLPLRNLSACDEGDKACVHQNGGGEAMNHIDTFCFSRRDLLKGGGALIIGFRIAGSPLPAAAARGDVAGPPDLNAIDSWIAVHADNTATVYLGKGEFGQGNTTGLLQIAGEELDLDMSQLRAVRLDTNVTPNQGATSSSSSIHRGGPQVRAAAAEARQALLLLASARLGVQMGSLTVSNGVVSVDGEAGLRSVKYGDLLGDKPFNIKFTGTAPQKPVGRYKLVGTRVPRVDIPDKVSGKYVHMQHVRLPDMLHGRVVLPRGQRAYGAGAKPLSIDESSIKSIPGARVVRKGDVVGVVAEREWDAVKAAQLLKVTWQEGPALPGNADLFEHMRAQKTTDTVIADLGDVAKAFAQAAHVASSTYRCPYQGHLPFAPNCALADVGPNGALVLSSTQDVYNARAMLATVLGLPVEKVRVQYYEGSGTFGRSCYEDAAQAAAIMSQAVGKPVRVQFMRWDEHG